MAKEVGEKKTKRKTAKPRRAGRKPKERERLPTEQEVKILASYFLTNREISAVTNIAKRTLERHFGEALKIGRDLAGASIKRKQFQLALGGNTALLIWLGKVYLGQKEMKDPLPDDQEQTNFVYKTQWGALDEFGDSETND